MTKLGISYLILLGVLFFLSVGLMLFSNHPFDGFLLFVAVMFNLMFVGMCGEELLLTKEEQAKHKKQQEQEHNQKYGIENEE